MSNYLIYENETIIGKGFSANDEYPTDMSYVKCTREESDNFDKYKVLSGKLVLKSKAELEIDKIPYKINDIKNLISKYQVFTIPFQYNKLKPVQQDELMLFLTECDKLLDKVTVDTVVPTVPDWLVKLEE